MSKTKPNTPPLNHYHNDHWTLDVKALGYDRIADQVEQMIAHCQPPFAVAICGGWGSGKSSLLNYICAKTGGRLPSVDPEAEFLGDGDGKGGEDNTVIGRNRRTWSEWREAIIAKITPRGRSVPCPSVWFNPWQHQFEAHPLRALLLEMHEQFGALVKAKEEGKKLATVTINTGLRLLGDLAKSVPGLQPLGVIDAKAIREEGERYEAEHFLKPLASQQFALHFEQAVQYLASAYKRENEPDQVQKGDRRVFIFVDDLDRCQPDRAYALLESMKLFLSTRNCVFILGLDYERLVHELGQNVATFGKSDYCAADYLDKMFQAIVRIPAPQDAQFSAFTAGLCHETRVDGCLLCRQMPWLVPMLERNPRRVKNFINSLKLRLAVSRLPANTTEDSVRKMILVHYLRIHYPAVYSVLEADPEHALPDICDALSRGSGRGLRRQFIGRRLRNDLAWETVEARGAPRQDVDDGGNAPDGEARTKPSETEKQGNTRDPVPQQRQSQSPSAEMETAHPEMDDARYEHMLQHVSAYRAREAFAQEFRAAFDTAAKPKDDVRRYF